MFVRRARTVLAVIVPFALAACGGGDGGPTPPKSPPSSVAVVSGNEQAGLVGSTLSVPLVVRVATNGVATSGVVVSFAVSAGAATVSPASATTDTLGQAKTQLTLGGAAGSVTVTASVAGTSLVATFIESAGTTIVSTACSTGSAIAPSAGGVQPGLTGTGVCLSGGSAGSEYALVAFYANPDSSAITSLTVRTSGGATAVTSANVLPSLTAAQPAFGAAQLRVTTGQAAFDAKLRTMAHRDLSPLVPAARARFRQRPSFNAIPANPAIGSFYQLNAQGNFSCTNPIIITARVAAVSNLAIVVADTANPGGGFTDAEYAAFAAMFDTLISPIDVANFGQPTDIDNNGKTLIFFTKEVNKLTPKGGLDGGGVIGGFTDERDLFPTTDTPDLEGCAGSNYAEMYYSLVPDPNGKYSDPRAKADVQAETPGTLVHEFQHLINAGRRIYVNDAFDFEDVWLNEGLSHIAEELLYYRAAGRAPRQNIDASVIGASQAAVDNFNNYQGDNFGRFEVYLGMPAQSSPFAENDNLETRGATWNLLRYFADHQSVSDATTFFALVNSQLSGQANLAGVFGASYMTQISNWATSVFADDVPGMNDVRFSDLSWNMRSIFPRLVNSSGVALGKYPLAVLPVSDVSPSSTSIDAGGAAYFRFFVPANATVSADWTAGGGLPTSPLVQFTIVRTR